MLLPILSGPLSSLSSMGAVSRMVRVNRCQKAAEITVGIGAKVIAQSTTDPTVKAVCSMLGGFDSSGMGDIVGAYAGAMMNPEAQQKAKAKSQAKKSAPKTANPVPNGVVLDVEFSDIDPKDSDVEENNTQNL